MKTLVLLVCLLISAPAWAMPIEWINTTVNVPAQTVDLTIQFAGVPDLYSADQYNRQADSFQLYTFVEPQITNGGLGGPYDLVTSITRGEELHYGEGLPIRDGIFTNAEDVFKSGGWGSVIGQVPVSLQGSLLTYTTGLEVLGVGRGLTPFGYGWESYEFGNGVNGPFYGLCNSSAKCYPTPEPSPFWMLGLGVARWMGYHWMRLRRRA